jgi:hypothetical protein
VWGVPELPKNRWGGWLEWVSLPTYTTGFPILKKILEKKFGIYKIYVIPLGWWLGLVILYTYIEKVFII